MTTRLCQRLPVSNPWNLWMSMEKRVFVDVIRLRNLRWADYPGLRRRALNTNTITNILTRGEQREIWPQMEDRRCRVTTEGGLREMKPWVAESQRSPEAGSNKGKHSPLGLPSKRDRDLASTLTLTQWNGLWTSGLQICERVSSCSFKPLESVIICYSSHRKVI